MFPHEKVTILYLAELLKPGGLTFVPEQVKWKLNGSQAYLKLKLKLI